jgi:hypothetical protein
VGKRNGQHRDRDGAATGWHHTEPATTGEDGYVRRIPSWVMLETRNIAMTEIVLLD